MILTAKNYFSRKANLEYMSASQFKAFSQCPAAAMAELKGKYKREKTTAMLVGSYVDSYFEGTLEAFKKQNPEIFKRDGTLKADFLQAEEIIRRIEREKLFMKYLNGEKQVIMTGSIAGVQVKIKVDALHSDRIVDLKIMRDFAPVYIEDQGKMPWFAAWGYDLQGAVYQEIVRQNTGKRLPFFLAAATKEKITDLDIVRIVQADLDVAFDRFARDAPGFDAIKCGIMEAERCENCEYCKISKRLKAPTDSTEFYW